MKTRKKPERSCIVCREKFDKRDLMRIVRTKEGDLFLDPTGKANGRGAYICHKPECIEKFSKKGFLERSYKTNISNEQTGKIREQIASYLENSNLADSEDKPMN